ERAQRADAHRQRGYRNRPRSCREIPQLLVTTGLPCSFTFVLHICRADVSQLVSLSSSCVNSRFLPELESIAIFQQCANSLHQRGSAGAQLADTISRYLFEQLFAARQQRHQDAPAVVPAAAAAHVTMSF